MTCALCGADTAAGAGFCGSCGVMLGSTCAACGAANHPRARRCGACGAGLATSLEPARPSPRAPRDSRRIVTVLFADIAGYTGMVESFGDQAEQVRSMLRECFDALAAIVIEHGGTVEKFIGDAICALFGAPTVHEDDPERALATALRMQRAMDRLNRERRESAEDAPVLSLRIGISTGEVVGGTADHAGEEQYSVTGDAVNTASRLQSAAEPGQILVAAATERLARLRFVFESEGEVKLKGKRAPVSAFRLVGERQEEVEPEAGLVGRRRELEHLRFCLKLAAEGSTQLVELVGDAGVGKSRLVSAFADEVSSEALVCRGSSPPMASTPLFPFQSIAAELLRELPSANGDGDGAEFQALQDLVSGGPSLDDGASVQNLAEALTEAVKGRTQPSGTIIVVENAHRADEDTLELLRRLATTIRNERLLLVWTRRTGEEPLLEGDSPSSLTRLVLRPLRPEEAEDLMDQLLDGVTLPAEVHDVVLDRSGGNPLYIEAMVQALLEGETLGEEVRLDAVQVPATVQGLIQARLDALPEPQRLLLQEAAVVGREFEASLLARVDLFGVDVGSALEELQRRGVIEHVGGSTYRFQHVLSQEVAYETMLQGLRSELHREVAEALLDLNPDRAAELAPTVADHYAKAGDTDRAVEVLVQAGLKE